MEEIKGKRLLVLGGSLWKNAIKDFCSRNDITIIAAGNDPDAGICEIADEYYNVNSTDAIVMKKLITEKKIDGVYMGGSEPVIAAACQYINELGFPCYCTKEQWDALQNKEKFKELCIKFGLPVAKRYEKNEVQDSDFPLITKPADGCASNGFSVCRDREELNIGYREAENASPSGSVIIEQFLPNNGIVVIYTVSNGIIHFSTIEDKHPVLFEKYGTYVGGLFVFESALKKEFRERFEAKIQRFVEYLEIKEGNFWIEVFHDGDSFFFNEVGFRYGGSGTLYPVNYFSGINQVASDIYYSLSGKSKILGFNELYGKDIHRKKKYAIYPLFLKSGIIGTIDGIEELRKDSAIINILNMKTVGSSIPDNGSFAHVSLLVHFVYDTVDELKACVDKIHDLLKIKDIKGESMIIKLLDIDNFASEEGLV